MRYSRIKKALALISFAIFFLIVNAFALTPPYMDKTKVRLSLDPEEISYGEFVITNPDANGRHMRLYLEDWLYSPSGDGSKEFFPANTKANSCSSWITFSPAEFDLAPYSKQRVSFSIKAPKQAVGGGYYSVLFFESSLGNDKGISGGQVLGAGLNIVIRTGALFYVEIKNGILRSADLGDVKFAQDNKLGYLLEVDLMNSGNTDIVAAGSFHIMDSKGVIYARGEFDKVYTLSRGRAKLKSYWKEIIPKGKYDLVLTIDLGKALEEAGVGRGPIVVKEGEIEIGPNGEILKVGPVK